MALVDEITIKVKAGRGGDGVVRWLHEKNKEYGGPAGGDGGKGGNIYARGLRDIGILGRYRGIKEFRAKDGEAGGNQSMHGKSGEDFVIDVPVGSVLKNKTTGEEFELLAEGEPVLLLMGGAGGMGNIHFKSSMHQRPTESTPGKEGEQAEFFIELRLIADAGLIGLPNAGKSSMLNSVTRANVKVGSYAFTTLEPNLGVMNGFILADIPGLIEGASEGKGLGHRFLRHIRRTQVLVHCISAEQEDFEVCYKTIRDELSRYDAELLNKKEIIVLTKSDVLDQKTLASRLETLRKRFPEVYTLSILDDRSIKEFSQALSKDLSDVHLAKQVK
ncbi:MAG: hypothetical protein A2664_00500 [Candidatus Taylorbacteria bacterium RIFCSPHIGHO2_01_FULL_46_22b]|uniref:GTPase Obg n=1 Tax=Candidatus Taylorbacteria bacterium RIFCSPHIGHO2_01_FULL_46_22b TaxID=1802301 RepID=A0A1G2M3D5_9BACT|nr:MAG: hypothetical protein A2664_00500 [Candidatus Taylorbacteria bacterium RIFCSPHIGHO2_01_FULL_46_22b]